MNVAYNQDCMDALKEFSDNYFTLCCADPPYGINVTGRHRSQSVKAERERERERAAHRLSEAAADRSAVSRVYGESTKALATQNFIPCSMIAPHRTRKYLGSLKE